MEDKSGLLALVIHRSTLVVPPRFHAVSARAGIDAVLIPSARLTLLPAAGGDRANIVLELATGRNVYFS